MLPGDESDEEEFEEEQAEEPDEDEADDGEASTAAGEEDEEGQVQRKLQLYQSSSIQMSIKRIWDILPKDEAGSLTMDGYVEFNLRLQKCLTPEFDIERAVDSAIGDWCEDVQEGQEVMTEQEFAMFLFELSSLWCGPTVSLLVYLLFLCAAFVAITEARGAHTAGLRPLDAIELLPKSFFDLLSVQGWAKMPQENEGLSETGALELWQQLNLAPESERAALLQVQRQLFHITRDVRAALLFRHVDGRQQGGPSVMELLKHSTQQLDKVSKAEPRDRALALPPGPSKQVDGPRPSPKEVAMLPWCPPMHARIPGVPAPRAGRAEAAEGASLALARPTSATRARRSAARRSASVPSAGSEQPQPPPLGRAFDTRRAPTVARGRGLALAGRAALGGGGSSDVAGASAGRPSQQQRAAALSMTSPSQPPRAPSRPESPAWGMEEVSALLGVASPSQTEGWPEGDPAEHEWDVMRLQTFMQEATFMPPYKLPKTPGDLYTKQVEPFMQATPSGLLFQINKWQKDNKLVPEPFERVLKKLPPSMDPGPGGPGVGPLAHPTEPVWFEMNHRLQAILKRQGRRAERKRKRRLRSKLLTGRAKGSGNGQGKGQGLRAYFDSQVLQRADGQVEFPPPASTEFLDKVHEQQLRRREASLRRPKYHQAPVAPYRFVLPVTSPSAAAR